MKLLTFFLFVTVASVTANSYSQKTKFNLNLENATVSNVFNEIEKTSEFIFIYSEKSVNVERKVDVKVEDETVNSILDQLFKGTNNYYEIHDRQIMVLSAEPRQLQLPKISTSDVEQPKKKEISGSVKDRNGPLPGVTVIAKGTTIGTITDVDGKFSLSVPMETKIIAFSFVGMHNQDIVLGNQTKLDITMVEALIGVEEVVVVGYGTQKKTTITGSVSAVQSKELVKSPVANISNAIVGKMSGVLTFQQSSEPGVDNVIMRIRGASTFAGSTEPLLMVDGIEVSNINNIDPYDVESVTVLKDASSTAVYGVRGANGVLLITTKRGSVGKPKFSLTSNASLNTFTETRKRMNAYDWTRLNNEALKYDSYISGIYNPRWTDADIEHWRLKDDPIFHPDADWMKFFFKDKTWQQNHNLSVSGGTDKVKYFLSVGYLQQFGQMNNTKLIPDFYDINIDYRRYNFRSNFDFAITKRLTAIVNISSQIEDKRGMNGDYESAVRFISLSSPITTPGVIDGKFINLPGISALNPVLSMYQQGYRKLYRNNLNGLVRLNYNLDYITEGLSTHGQISYNTYNTQNLTFSPAIQQFSAIRAADGSVVFEPTSFPGPVGTGEGTDKRRMTSSEFGFDYARSFGPHNVSGLLLYTQTKLFSPALAYLIPKGLQGGVGRATYDYKKRYLAEFDFGYNGSENFNPKYRYGFFPAYSAGWVLSEEPFFPENNIVTFAKIRGSYGEVGNENNGGERFLYRDDSYVYSAAVGYYFGEAASSYNLQNGSQEGKLGNPLVGWERAKKSNIGVELNLFKNKLKVSADYFLERRGNILSTKQSVPMLFAATLPAVNFGKMKNSGVDGEISFSSSVGKFNYWLKGNYTYAHNVVLESDEVKPQYPYQRYTGQSLNQKMMQVNYGGLYNTWDELSLAYRPKSSFNGNRQQPGDVILKDINGDGTLDSYDCVPIGYSWFPEISYGFSFGGEYKGFDFSALFQGNGNVSFMPGFANQYGGWVAYQVGSGWASSGQTAGPAYLVDQSWTQERYSQGLPINFPHVSLSSTTQQQNFQWSTYWHRDASYLRLKNAEIGYTFKGSMLNKIGISSARLYVNGNNLITWDKLLPGWDPETYYINGNLEPYPKVRVFNVGANINF